MRRPNNWDYVKPAVGGYTRENLPAGGYEARIINAAVLTNSNGSESLAVQVDITAGEFKDFFKRDFESNPYDNKKWRGTARFFVPVDDGSDKDERTKGIFKAMTDAVEASNPGYKWNWDEKTLKGLKVGIMVRDKEYFIEDSGAHGFTHDIYRFVGINVIKEGKFTIPKPKLLNGGAGGTSDSGGSQPAQSYQPPQSSQVPPQGYGDPPPALGDYPF